MYYLYILKCNDDSLYTGVAKDLKTRLATHSQGKGSKYVRSRLPFELVYHEKHQDRSTAQKREAEIKSWPRSKKLSILNI